MRSTDRTKNRAIIGSSTEKTGFGDDRGFGDDYGFDNDYGFDDGRIHDVRSDDGERGATEP